MKTNSLHRRALELAVPAVVFFLGLMTVVFGQLALAELAEQSAEPVAIIVQTPGAPHAQARVRVVDLAAGVIVFDWMDAQGQPVDSGNSLARITVTGDSITAEQRAILAAGITAATAAP
jgi:hypothetical protein